MQRKIAKNRNLIKTYWNEKNPNYENFSLLRGDLNIVCGTYNKIVNITFSIATPPLPPKRKQKWNDSS